MTDRFKPHDFPPYWIFGADYWSVIYQDIFDIFWNSLTWGLTGKLPPSHGHVIKYCGNPECNSLIAFYPDKTPSGCRRCGKEIDWDYLRPISYCKCHLQLKKEVRHWKC